MASVTRPTVVAFIAEFLRTGNATKSAIKAGYPEKTAYQQGFRLLKRPEVQEAIASANKVAMDEAIVDKTYVLKNLREVVERCLQRAPVMKFDPEEKQYSQKIDDKGNLLWEFDSAGANSALSIFWAVS